MLARVCTARTRSAAALLLAAGLVTAALGGSGTSRLQPLHRQPRRLPGPRQRAALHAAVDKVPDVGGGSTYLVGAC
jgi:hypothetical protein